MAKFNNFFKKIKNFILDYIYPNKIKCIFCGDELFDENIFETCEHCFKTIPFVTGRTCKICGKPIVDETDLCSNCVKHERFFDKAYSCFEYTNSIISLIHKLKYSSYKFVTDAMANFMYYKLESIEINFDEITFVPSHISSYKKRRYNQAEILASKLSKLTLIECVNAVNKIKKTKSQASLTRKKRLTNLIDCFEIDKNYSAKNKNILLIDDVLTTGSTVNEVARMLKHAGASKVYVLTFATTPLKPIKKTYIKEKHKKNRIKVKKY